MAKKFDKVTSLESLEAKLAEMREAQAIYSKFPQEQVDEICKQAAMAADKARIPLAKMANAETGMGVVEDKVIKNNYAAEHIFNYFRHMKTCGVISEDKAFGTKRIAEPVGIVGAVTPTTNPTSTAIFKCLLALKTIPPPRSAPSRPPASCVRPPRRPACPRTSSAGWTRAPLR